MYTRGQFAVIGSVGRKALRLYHEEGILVPAYTNSDNGYHYYEESQLETLERIKGYRKLGLSLFEIRQIFDGKASEAEIIQSRINETDRLLREMRAYKTSSSSEGASEDAAQIDRRPFGACRCIFVCENTEREHLGMSVGKLYEKASREGIQTAGDHFVIFDGVDDEDSFSMKTCLPVQDYRGEDVIEVSEKDCIHISFKGGFSKIWKAHRLLKKYAAENGITTAGRVYEVYNRDMSADVYYAVTE